jgi:hypothetical protein
MNCSGRSNGSLQEYELEMGAILFSGCDGIVCIVSGILARKSELLVSLSICNRDLGIISGASK